MWAKPCGKDRARVLARYSEGGRCSFGEQVKEIIASTDARVVVRS